MKRRAFRKAILVALTVVLASGAAQAVYPERPIKIIVPYAAGSATDTSTRVIADYMARDLGQPIVIENRPGAGGNIGSQVVAQSAPDGYQLVAGTIGSHAINMFITPNMPYDAQRDFTPVALTTLNAMLVVVSKSVLATNLKELVELSKKKPGGYSYGSAGVGSGPHLAGELLKQKTGANLVHVPYKDAGQSVSDILGDRLEVLIYPMPALLPHVTAGTMKAVAALSENRQPKLPQIPTAIEQGLDGFVVDGWNGLLGPKGMSEDIVARLNAAVNSALKDPEVRQKLTAQGLQGAGGSPSDFAKFIASELKRWGEVVKDAKIGTQ